MWTEEDELTLRAEWPLRTAKDLSRLLGGRHTTNSIIGKAWRLKLNKREKVHKPVYILDLRPRQCRAVLDVEARLFCGLHAPKGSSWCDAHRAIYVRP